MIVSLLFPPGWTLATGSAHVAVPALASWLAKHGFEVIARDLNFEVAQKADISITCADARRAILSSKTDKLYFEVEDELCRYVSSFDARWNPQLGFGYNDVPQSSSKRAFKAVAKASPFDTIFEEVAQGMVAKKVGLVGFCLSSVYQIVPTLQLCRHLRENGYEGFIALGGNTVSRLAAELARSEVFSLVDGLITFQGEMPLLRLCEALDAGKSLECVPQLIWRGDAGIHWNKQTERFGPDAASPPAYDHFPVGRYWGENYLNVVASRGCYYGKCSFCDIPYGWGENGYAGQRAVNLVRDDIETLMQRHEMSRYKFVDEALSPRFMRDFSRQLLDRGLQIEWEGYTRLEAAWNDADFVRLVAKAGFRKGYFGLEILPSEGRNGLNKRDDANPEMLLRLCNDNGIKVHFFCMFGYPGTGEADAVRTLDFVLDNRDRIDTADVFPWTLAKHTKVPGVGPVVDRENDWALEFDHVSDDPSAMSQEQIRELVGHCEEILWQDAPRLLHPIYRMVSPWSDSSQLKPITSRESALIPA